MSSFVDFIEASDHVSFKVNLTSPLVGGYLPYQRKSEDSVTFGICCFEREVCGKNEEKANNVSDINQEKFEEHQKEKNRLQGSFLVLKVGRVGAR